MAPPFRGHLHPILGIARAISADCEVVVGSTEKVQGAIAAAEVPARVLMPGADPAIQAISDPPHSVGSNPLRLDRQLRANLALLGRFKEELRALWTARRPDLVIADLTLPIAGILALEMGIPWWTSHPSPCAIEAADGPPAYMGGLRQRHDLFGRARDAAGRALVRAFKRSVFFWYRREFRALGVPAVYRADGSEAVYSPQKVLGLGWPELEVPRRLPPAVELVGYPLYTPPFTGPPPPFRQGRRHVLVSLGTHLWWRKDEVAAAAAAAARRLPEVEIHFTDGDPAGDRREAEANFHRLAYVSYQRDLARYDLVVHHAGTGALYYTLAAGLPALTLPSDYDQFDCATRLEERRLARRLRSPRELPAAISEALGETPERANSRAFARVLAERPAEERIRDLVVEFLRARPRSGQ